MSSRSRRKKMSLPVGVAEETAQLLKKAAENQSLTTCLRRKLSKAAAEMEVRISLAKDGQISVPKKMIAMMLRGMTGLVHFRHEIKEMANALMGMITK